MVCQSDVYQGSPLFTVVGCTAGRTRHGGVRRQLHLVRNVPRHHEAEPLACLRRDEHRVAELDLLLLRGRRSARATAASVAFSCFISVRCAEVGAHRTRDGQRQHADDRGEDRGPPRSRAEPLLGLLFRRLRDGLRSVADRLRLGLGSRRGTRVFGRRAGSRRQGSAPRRPARSPLPAYRPRGRGPPLRIGPLRFGHGLFGLADREPREGQVAGVAGGVAEGLLDAQQLVVLGDTLAAGRVRRS